MRCIKRLALFFLSAFWAAVPAQYLKGADIVVFDDVRVFDGQTMLSPRDVLIQAGIIQQVAENITAPAEAEVINGSGKTLLPGFIDSHTHAFLTQHLEDALVFGVTTELDMFSDHHFASQMRAEQAAGKARRRADLRSAGTLVTAAGGHGTQFGVPIATISGPEQAQDFVAARVAEGSDYIKIVYDDGEVYGLRFPTISRETLAAVVQAAHARQKLAVAHVSTVRAAQDAIEAGIDGLVHIFVDAVAEDALVELAAQRQIFVVPTLTVLHGLTPRGGEETMEDDPLLLPFLTPDMVFSLRSSFPRQGPTKVDLAAARESVSKLSKAGVTILAGTDAANPGTAHGVSIHREMQMLVSAGLSPMQALAGATSLPAEKFQLQDRGRIAPQLRADLVLVEGDPSEDIAATRAIVGVWKAGHRLDREARRKRVEAEKNRLAAARNVPAPPNSESGLVSDFEGQELKSEFGAGWSISSDSLVGGKSSAESKIAAPGAGDSQGALLITGTIEDRPQPRWAGMMFSPGEAMFSAANLSAKKSISFSAKGDGKTYLVMLFFQRKGFQPSILTFVAGSEWKQHRFALRDFSGCEGTDIVGLFFGAGSDAGPFALQIDDVRFEK